MARGTYTVRYELDEAGWWVASISDVAGCHTQGRTIEQARERVREALALCTSDRHAANATLEDEVVLKQPLGRALANVTAKRALADRLAAEAEDAARDAAVMLSKSMGLRDVGALLGVSRQRAHQLVSDSNRKAGAIGKAKLEALLLEGLRSGSAVPLRRATFDQARTVVRQLAARKRAKRT